MLNQKFTGGRWKKRKKGEAVRALAYEDENARTKSDVPERKPVDAECISLLWPVIFIQ